MSKKIAINGFGRIGRTFLRVLLADAKARKELAVKVINIGPAELSTSAHLFKYDSLMGTFQGNVSQSDSHLIIDDQVIKLVSEKDATSCPWSAYDIDWVVEASGHYTSREKAKKHLEAGAKKVLLTAPGKDEDITIIPGINSSHYNSDRHAIVSLGSCTTNCFAPLIKVLHENFGIQNGIMTTVHSYTNDQVLLDVEHTDPRRARAACLNIIPTKTGAAETIYKVFPELKGKLFASALRVPVPKVSLIEFTFVTTVQLTIEKINGAFVKASSHGDLSTLITCTQEPLVSSDFNHSPYSATIDLSLTQATNTLGKVVAWYDNEWGYCSRLKDFLTSIS